MKVLILSCKTGGGHDAAGRAILEQLQQMGEEAYLFDYLTLAGQKVSDRVGGGYVGLVQRVPLVFGLLYRIGAIVSRIVRKSPVYYMNGLMAPYLDRYLREHQFDAIVMPHLFPAETITYMKRKGMELPLTVAVATDYTCIPFWGETECDYYVIPSEKHRRSFTRGHIRAEQLLPYGIPVSPELSQTCTRRQARERLHITHERPIYLVVGGSMGAGQMQTLVRVLLRMKRQQDDVIVVCGSNRKVRKKMKRHFKGREDLTIIGRTDQMPDYLRACDVLFTKPGGLTSTEAAVAEIPMVHTAPIPGCETVNRRYFRKRGMSVSGADAIAQVAAGIRLMEQEPRREAMKRQQGTWISKHAAEDICRFLKEATGK